MSKSSSQTSVKLKKKLKKKLKYKSLSNFVINQGLDTSIYVIDSDSDVCFVNESDSGLYLEKKDSSLNQNTTENDLKDLQKRVACNGNKQIQNNLLNECNAKNICSYKKNQEKVMKDMSKENDKDVHLKTSTKSEFEMINMIQKIVSSEILYLQTNTSSSSTIEDGEIICDKRFSLKSKFDKNHKNRLHSDKKVEKIKVKGLRICSKGNKLQTNENVIEDVNYLKKAHDDKSIESPVLQLCNKWEQQNDNLNIHQYEKNKSSDINNCVDKTCHLLNTFDNNGFSTLEFGGVNFMLSPEHGISEHYSYMHSPTEIIRNRNINSATHEFKSINNEDNILFPELQDVNLPAGIFFLFHTFCIAIFKRCSKVYFSGKLVVLLLQGNVEILGHKLTENPEELYSVRYETLLNFELHKNSNILNNLVIKLKSYDIPKLKIDEIIKNVSNEDTVFLLKPLNNPMTEFISKHLENVTIFSQSKKSKSQMDCNITRFLQCSFYYEEYNEDNQNGSQWNTVVNSVSSYMKRTPKNIVLICGGKNVGKSTMLRYLVNKCIEETPVLVLDFDPGQPEFTVCGLLSVTVTRKPLLGPNFTHLTQPDRSLCLGFLNVIENKEKYVACVTELINYCTKSEKYSNMPWIINTMGFTDSLGLQLLLSVLNVSKPTAVIEILSANHKYNYEFRLNPENVNAYHETLDTTETNKFSIVNHDYQYFSLESFDKHKKMEYTSTKHAEAKTQRMLNLLSYFSPLIMLNKYSLLEVNPYVVQLSKIQLYFNNVIVEDSYVFTILNGRVVALCHNHEHSETGNAQNYKSIMECFGYGLVRGIDIKENKAYILTPLDSKSLLKVNALVHSEVMPDCCSILSAPHLRASTQLPYTLSLRNILKNKHLHKIPKRKFNPHRLLKMAKKSQ